MKSNFFLCSALISLAVSQNQIASDLNGESYYDRLGHSVSLKSDVNGTYLAVGVPEYDSAGLNSGQVKVYSLLDNSWVQSGDDINGLSSNELSGSSVSISSDGNSVAVGSPQYNQNGNDIGKVVVYRNVIIGGNEQWSAENDIVGENTNDLFGYSVSLAGGTSADTVAIGAPGKDDSTGEVKIYWLNGSSWDLLGSSISGESLNDEFGKSISISQNGTRVAIGAPFNDDNGLNSGQVRIYDLDQNEWVENMVINGVNSGDNFGMAVSLSENGLYLAVGASNANYGSGYVHIYEEYDGNWIQSGYEISGEFHYDNFGSSVSISDNGSRVLIGAPNNNASGNNSGTAYIYELVGSDSTWYNVGSGISGSSSNDQFGFSVSLSGDGVSFVVGSPGNESSAGQVSSYHLEISQMTIVPDMNFENKLIELGFDDRLNGVVLTDSLISIEQLNVTGSGISNLMGIEAMVNLERLECGYNDLIQLDISNNVFLQYLNIRHNQLESIDLSNNESLNVLLVNHNDLGNLDLSNNINITDLDVSNNSGLNFNVTGLQQLTNLRCRSNNLYELDVMNNSELQVLDCHNNSIGYLDLSLNTKLQELDVAHNQLTDLNVIMNDSLVLLRCSNNLLTELDLSNNSILQYLYCHQNSGLGTLDISNTSLVALHCYGSSLNTLLTGSLSGLTTVYANNNDLTTLNLSGNPNMYILNVSNNNLTSLNLNNGNTENLNVGSFNAYNNSLDCISVSNVDWAINNLFTLSDAGVDFSLSCGSDPYEPEAIDIVTYIEEDNQYSGSFSAVDGNFESLTFYINTVPVYGNIEQGEDNISYLNFDGIDDWVDTYIGSNELFGKSSLTFDISFKRLSETTDGQYQGLISSLNSGNSQVGLRITGENNLRFEIYDQSSSALQVAYLESQDIAFDTWYDLKIELYQNTVEWFMEGLLIETDDITFQSVGQESGNIPNIVIGKGELGNGEYFNGSIKKLRISDRTQPQSSSTIANWDFNKGYGNYLDDLSDETSIDDALIQGATWGVGGPTFLYTPDLNYNGSDSFTFTVSDGTTSDNGTVLFNIIPVNDAPIVSDTTIITDYDSSITFYMTAYDVEGDDFTFQIINPPTNGFYDGVEYKPDAGFIGNDDFSYTATDNSGLENAVSMEATVTIMVRDPNNPPIADNMFITTGEDTTYSGVLQATDMDDDALFWEIVTQPINGQVAVTTDNGNFQYFPNQDYFGSDTFSFKVSDEDYQDTAFVYVTIEPVNDAPITILDDVNMNEDTELTIHLTATDIDSDINLLTYSVEQVSDIELLLLGNNNDSLLIIPAADWYGQRIIEVAVSDGELQTVGSFVLTVNNVDDEPIVYNELDTLFIYEDFEEIIALDMTSVFVDIDGELIFSTEFLGPEIVNATADGNLIVLTPILNSYGSTQLKITATNPSRASISDTLGIIIQNINDPPILTSENVSLNEDSPTVIKLDAYDVDSDLSLISYSVIDNLDSLDLNIFDGDSLQIIPDLNWNGQDTAIVWLNDGIDSSSYPIVITVEPVNDPPIIISEMSKLVGLNRQFIIPLEVFDVDLDTAVISMDSSFSNPDWVALVDNTLLGQSDTLGDFDILLNVSDNDTTYSDIYTIQVKEFVPVILSVSDVPNDQGGKVYVHFTPSGLDDGTDGSYAILRYDSFAEDSSWVIVIPAIDETEYIAEVPTLLDSTSENDGLTYFKVVAQTSEGAFSSEPMAGYSTDDLAPGIPQNILVSQGEIIISLSWESQDEDVDYFTIYRSEVESFFPISDNFVGYSVETSFIDTSAQLFTNYYYKVRATDFSGNMSELSVSMGGFSYLNYPPVLSPPDSQFINEDEEITMVISAVDNNESDILIYNVSTSNDAVICNIQSDTLNISLVDNWFGSAELSLHVSDGELSDSNSFFLTVYPVNDSPTANVLWEPVNNSTVILSNQSILNGAMQSFLWGASSDVDGDPISYRFSLSTQSLTGVNDQIIIDTLINGRQLNLSHEIIYTSLIHINSDSVNCSWSVYSTDGQDSTISDVWEIVFDLNDVLSIDGEFIPSDFALYQNHPNPFNPTTTINFDLPQNSTVKLDIYDIVGRNIRNLINSDLKAGKKSITWDACNNNGENVSAGMYIYIIQAGDYVATKKMLLLK